jgi:hypothetical protein
MSPFATVAVKTLGAAGIAAMLSLGAVTASAATSNPKPTPSAAAGASKPSTDRRADLRAVRRAIIESEADVLGITPETLVKDLKAGQKVSDLARDKGMTKEQFETKLVADLKPKLEALVENKVITQPQADKVLDRISKGYVPFWNGIDHGGKHHKK